MRRLLLGACMLSLAGHGPVLAQQGGYAGDYAGRGEGDLTARLRQLSGNRYHAAISTTVRMAGNQPGCGGAIEGEVALTPDGHGVLQAENEDHDPESSIPARRARHCTITIGIDGRRMRIEEGDGCLGYHGAACGFTGELRRR